MLKYNVVARKNPRTNKVMYYAQLQPVTPIRLTELAEAISGECTVTIHDIKAVISALEAKVISYLSSGMSVRLGDLGSFRPTISSRGAETAKAFSAEHVRGVRVQFAKSGALLHQFSLNNPRLRVVKAGVEAEAPENADEQAGV